MLSLRMFSCSAAGRGRPDLRRLLFSSFLLLTMFALIASAAVPAGYMLAPTQESRLLHVELCSANGPSELVIDLGPESSLTTNRGSSAPESPENHTTERCTCMTGMSFDCLEPALALGSGPNTPRPQILIFETHRPRAENQFTPWPTGPPAGV